MSFDIHNVLAWCKDNQIVLGLLGSAVVGTMPEALPTLQYFPQWAWTWFREASKTFLNFRRGIQEPAPTPTPMPKPPTPPSGPQQLNG
jgi:hypothetical protein